MGHLLIQAQHKFCPLLNYSWTSVGTGDTMLCYGWRHQEAAYACRSITEGGKIKIKIKASLVA